MTIYILFFLLVFLVTILGNQIFGRNNLKTIIIPLLIMILFAGLRGDVGTDTFSYKTFFNSFESDVGINFTLEPLFVFFTYLVNFIWSNDQFYIFILSVTTGVLLYYNLKLVEEKSLFLLFYLTGYYIIFNFNLMRFGIGVLLMSFPYLLKLRGEKSKIGFYFLGFLTHFTTLIVLFFVIQKKHVFKFVIFFVTFNFLFGQFLLKKFEVYFLASLISIGNFHFDFGLLFEIGILLILFWINRNDIGRGMILLLFIYIVLRNLGFLFDMLQRFAYIIGLLIYLNFFYKKQGLLTRGIFYILIIFNLYRSLMFINNSDLALDELIANYPGFSTLYSQTKWLPFRFFWEE